MDQIGSGGAKASCNKMDETMDQMISYYAAANLEGAADKSPEQLKAAIFSRITMLMTDRAASNCLFRTLLAELRLSVCARGDVVLPQSSEQPICKHIL